MSAQQCRFAAADKQLFAAVRRHSGTRGDWCTKPQGIERVGYNGGVQHIAHHGEADLIGHNGPRLGSLHGTGQ